MFGAVSQSDVCSEPALFISCILTYRALFEDNSIYLLVVPGTAQVY